MSVVNQKVLLSMLVIWYRSFKARLQTIYWLAIRIMEHMLITCFALIFICTATEPDVYYFSFTFTGNACRDQINLYLQQKYKTLEEAEEDLHININ